MQCTSPDCMANVHEVCQQVDAQSTKFYLSHFSSQLFVNNCGLDGKAMARIKRELRAEKEEKLKGKDVQEVDLLTEQNLRHKFTLATYLRPTFCNHCGLLFVGLYQQVFDIKVRLRLKIILQPRGFNVLQKTVTSMSTEAVLR